MVPLDGGGGATRSGMARVYIEQSIAHSLFLKNLAKSSEGKRNRAGRTDNRMLINDMP